MFADKEEFKTKYENELIEQLAKPFEECSRRERYEVLVRMIANRASLIHTETKKRYEQQKEKKIFYFSMEFLLGRLLDYYLIDLGIEELVREGLSDLGEDLDLICKEEQTPGLGNGGLGRLAACFLDSMAFLDIPGTGVGIRYRYGLFKQQIENGYQVETPDPWLTSGYPWETRKFDGKVEVHYGGTVSRRYENGKIYFDHVDYQTVLAIPYDIPVIGYGGHTSNMLQIWQAEPAKAEFDLTAFNQGDYGNAFLDRNEVEAITAVLYPDDSTCAGRTLRLKQEYFFVSAGVTSIINHYKKKYGTDAWDEFPQRIAIHTNDTHPALCAPELMRILLDEEGLEWDDAWAIMTKTISYTNHTVLPEALETWPIELFRSLLPRVYMIVEEMDRRYRESFQHKDDEWQKLWMSTAILWDGQVRMANLSTICSHSVNGVAALHTNILKNTVLKDFYQLMPDKFNNKTNGVSHRRFLLEANPALSRLITATIGKDWILNPGKLENLLAYREDKDVLDALEKIKFANKCRLASYIKEKNGIIVDPASVFDIQVKRIHAYKRQILNIFKVLYLYNRLKENPALPLLPHTFIFAGKAAPGYALAKKVIKLINSVADIVNNDRDVNQKIKVVFLADFNVSNAQLIYPAADISEQISTAGKEASGTGNMKFMFNGALTLGTLDGANVEIHELVGDDNMFIFGLTAEEVMHYQDHGGYLSFDECQQDPHLQEITDQLINGFFKDSGEAFGDIYDNLLRNNDEYFVLKDFHSYMDTWLAVSKCYEDKARWGKAALTNIAKAGYFSSDRTISEYANEIWNTHYEQY